MKNLDKNIHYINKEKTKHYYIGRIFSNTEWDDYIHGRAVQGIRISLGSPYRKQPDNCDRWHRGKDGFNYPCSNKPIFKSNFGMYFCKKCTGEIIEENNSATFTKIR